MYAYNYTQDEKDYLAGKMEVTEIFEKDLTFLKGQEIVKCLYMNTDYSYLQEIAKDFEDITYAIDVSYSSNHYIEFNHKGVNKGVGLKPLADLLHVELKDMMAIGDNFNDLSIIKVSGLGVGVQNTVEEMKPCNFTLWFFYENTTSFRYKFKKI